MTRLLPLAEREVLSVEDRAHSVIYQLEFILLLD
jgi:hypothetical protein